MRSRSKKPKPPLYRVLVWDHETQDWIGPPNDGQSPPLWIGDGLFQFWKQPFRIMRTRYVLRMLRGRGYEVSRDSPSVWIERVGWEEEYRTKARPFKTQELF